MKTNDLRIGNWVHHTEQWSYRQDAYSTKMDEFDFQWEDIDFYALGECTLNLEYINPIPLTEEWLLKFGFTVTDEGAGFKALHFWHPLINDDKIYLRHYLMGGFIWGFNNFEELEQPISVKYVHQLQNLYFALTGEELTIKNE